MATCQDACRPSQPFAVRECFNEPVGFDLLEGDRKVLGGALRWTRAGALYQGSLQVKISAVQEEQLAASFQSHLNVLR
jgi:hypothetical protein